MLHQSDVKLRQWLGFLGLRTVVRGWGKLRTVLTLSDVIRDSAAQLVLTHQRARTGACGVCDSAVGSAGAGETQGGAERW
jgi:hypothetical protein